MNNKVFREAIVKSLKGEGAHISTLKVLKTIDPGIVSSRPKSEIHSPWENMEHMRIAQNDILQYTIDPEWVSPQWPDEYWPSLKTKVDKQRWEDSLTKFEHDLNRLIELVRNPEIDLTAPLPHAPHHTYLREVLLVVDHNAYHLAQIVLARKMLGDW